MSTQTATQNTTRPGQIAKANELLAEVAEVNGEYANQVWAEFKRTWARNECTFELVSARIGEMIDAKRAATKISQAVDLPEVPKGRYAVTGVNGSTDFYRVTLDKNGQYKVFLYVSDAQRPVTNWHVAIKVLRQIAKDGVEAAATRWGLEMVRCHRCGAQLTDEGNPFRHLGLGPECGKK
jgi:hypothetical protein